MKLAELIVECESFFSKQASTPTDIKDWQTVHIADAICKYKSEWFYACKNDLRLAFKEEISQDKSHLKKLMRKQKPLI